MDIVELLDVFLMHPFGLAQALDVFNQIYGIQEDLEFSCKTDRKVGITSKF